jgi:hypothetical protein
MRTRWILAAAALMVGFGFAGRANAEPLNLKQVADDAKWVVSVDFDALRASSIFQNAKKEFQKEHPEIERHLADLVEVWKFNPATDLHGVTIYGTQYKEGAGVAIVHAKVDPKVLAEKVAKAPEHRVSTYGKYEVHTWTHAKESKHERNMAGAFFAPDLVIFGGSANEVMAALDVLDGKKKNISEKAEQAHVAVPAGAIFVAHGEELGKVKLPCECPVLEMLESLCVAVGENDKEVFYQGMATTKDEETAKSLVAVINGGIALVSLAHEDEAKEFAKLLSNVKVTSEGKTVKVEFKAPAESVEKVLRAIAEKVKKGEFHPSMGAMSHRKAKQK